MALPDRRHMLGAFIRAHRERMPAPTHAGIRRRTPGLRREELADAAGMGVTWITWLEQGRAVNASVSALVRLAEALQLTPAERASLFDLAGRRDPSPGPQAAPEIPAAWRELTEGMPIPAYLLDPGWTAVAWNRAAADLFTGWLDPDATERNLLHFVYLHPAARTLIAHWPERAHRLAAEFRADVNRRPSDPALTARIETLLAGSATFAHHWYAQDVLSREGGERGFHHPVHGEQHYLQTTLLLAAQPDYKLVCLAPLPGTPAG